MNQQNLRLGNCWKLFWVTLKKLQNFSRVMCKFLLCKFRQCEGYSEQSKPYFEPSTFAWQRQRCLLQREYFDFVCLHFHWVFLLCLPNVFIIISSKKRIFIANARASVFVQLLHNWFWRVRILKTFVFLHHTSWELIYRKKKMAAVHFTTIPCELN